MSIRSLTGFPREKVKVLMVLYDGGKHAEEVSPTSVSLFLTQTSQCAVDRQQLPSHLRVFATALRIGPSKAPRSLLSPSTRNPRLG